MTLPKDVTEGPFPPAAGPRVGEASLSATGLDCGAAWGAARLALRCDRAVCEMRIAVPNGRHPTTYVDIAASDGQAYACAEFLAKGRPRRRRRETGARRVARRRRGPEPALHRDRPGRLPRPTAAGGGCRGSGWLSSLGPRTRAAVRRRVPAPSRETGRTKEVRDAISSPYRRLPQIVICVSDEATRESICDHLTADRLNVSRRRRQPRPSASAATGCPDCFARTRGVFSNPGEVLARARADLGETVPGDTPLHPDPIRLAPRPLRANDRRRVLGLRNYVLSGVVRSRRSGQKQAYSNRPTIMPGPRGGLEQRSNGIATRCGRRAPGRVTSSPAAVTGRQDLGG
jgi:hypothetical protein